MPILMDATMQELKTASNYKFSAVKVDQLGATEYTLVTIAQDCSGSVASFDKEMEKCLGTILNSCKKSPRAENLLLRLIKFNDRLEEVHGFKALNTIDAKDYIDILQPSGNTALFDSVQSAIEATKEYAGILHGQEFQSNAIIFIVTDGIDNHSSATASSIKKAVSKAVKEENLESLTIVLVGISSGDPAIAVYLDGIKNDAGITQFVDIGEASANKLAKLANFISKSISSTSQALQQGTSSTLLTF